MGSNGWVFAKQGCLSNFSFIKEFGEFMLNLGSEAGVHSPIIFRHIEAGREGEDALANVFEDACGKGDGERSKKRE